MSHEPTTTLTYAPPLARSDHYSRRPVGDGHREIPHRPIAGQIGVTTRDLTVDSQGVTSRISPEEAFEKYRVQRLERLTTVLVLEALLADRPYLVVGEGPAHTQVNVAGGVGHTPQSHLRSVVVVRQGAGGRIAGEDRQPRTVGAPPQHVAAMRYRLGGTSPARLHTGGSRGKRTVFPGVQINIDVGMR